MNRQFLLEMLPQGAIACEIGVARGNFSQKLLQFTKPKRLYLVDPWHFDQQEHQMNKWYSGRGNSQTAMDGVFAGVAARFEGDGRVEIRRKRSDEFLIESPKEFFDWIYVDGEHSFAGCMLDVLLSIPKVKVGGIICGDDYNWKPEDKFPVRRAVHTINKNDNRVQWLKSFNLNGQWGFRRVR